MIIKHKLIKKIIRRNHSRWVGTFCRSISLLTVVLTGLGCSALWDTPKTLWGSSTRALESVRETADAKVYYCSYDDCYDAVLTLAREHQIDEKSELDIEEEAAKSEKPLTLEEMDAEGNKKKEVILPQPKIFSIYSSNRFKGIIVVMGIPGQIETTEVGVFFTTYNVDSVKIEVVSLSTPAQRKVSKPLFTALDEQFTGMDIE